MGMWNKHLYHKSWKVFSSGIRLIRAEGRCECTGECGLEHPAPLGPRCAERNGKKALRANGRVFLSVAHLCDCSPPCIIAAHVKAMCQRCHLRTDRFTHAARRAAHVAGGKERLRE